MKSLLVLLAIIGFLVVAVAAYVWSGAYNVAANVSHRDVTVWFLEMVRNRSIAAHSKEIRAPSLQDPRLTRIGFRHYHSMCRLCHGAPGHSRTEIALGLNPGPPNLVSQQVQGRSDGQLYWIIKNGIKMTGMPAFGSTHSDRELWGQVAFIRQLPKLKPSEYEAMARALGLRQNTETDHHDNDDGDHRKDSF